MALRVDFDGLRGIADRWAALAGDVWKKAALWMH